MKLPAKAPFAFTPAACVPYKDQAVLERLRAMKREDMEKHPNPKLRIKIVREVTPLFVADCFTRIRMSDEQDKRLVMIFPNPWPAAYEAVAEMCNRYRVSLRNVHTFTMDEWADADGNVAPLSYGPSLGRSFIKHFVQALDADLRMPENQVHYFTNENYKDMSKIIDDVGSGGADICYSATGWPGHTAFIDPDTEAFKADTIEEFLELDSRFVLQHPLTIAENSLFSFFGASGDVAAIPPGAVTIGPRDIAHARDHFEMHSFVEASGNSWQRLISRLTLYGPVNMQCPASIIQLFPGQVYVSEAIAAPIVWEE